MWLLRQCLNVWDQTYVWSLPELIAEARKLPTPDALLNLDDPALALTGDMTARINEQRVKGGLPPLSATPEAAPYIANLIFHSLAGRYASLLDDMGSMTGKRPECIYVTGGGSRNEYLNALTSAASGVPVHCCSVESATLGNFAIQWARLEQPRGALTSESIAARSGILAEAQIH
jgi:rhamnulokinase